MKAFFKKNYKAIICYTLLVGLIICVIVFGVINYKENNTKNTATVLNASEFIEKMDKKEDFEIVMGAHTCSSCKKFNSTIKKYQKQEHALYYIYIDEKDDLYLEDAIKIFTQAIGDLPTDRGLYLATPTTFVIRQGEIKDAILGAVSYKDKDAYNFFKDVLKGVYIGKPIY